MKFGLFDHVDRSDRPLAQQFDQRVEFVRAADAAGFYCYQVAEHHATPLTMAAVPGVYLGALSRVTTRIRLGPLVYLLPLYSPLRLIEEIAILDHLSHGRLDLGVGRGVSPFELNYHKVDSETAREVFREALAVIRKGLTSERLSHTGPHFDYADVPMELRPLQRPHPPIWYGSSNEAGSAWAGEQGFNFVTLGAVEQAKRCIAAYRAALAERGGPVLENPDFAEGTVIGANRYMFVAETDEEAVRIARPAYDHWYANLTKLERENVAGPRIASSMFADVEVAMQAGAVIVGSPDTVRAAVASQIDTLGVNYMVLGMYFGTLSHDDAMRSQQLFAEQVMPAFTDK